MIITTKKDLRNYVDYQTGSWVLRQEDQIDNMTNSILSLDHPPYGTDWTEFLDSVEVSDFFFCEVKSTHIA